MSDESKSYEMLWDCPYCGQKKLLGVTHRHCPGCGAAQDPTKRYFPAPGEEIEVANHVFVGADKTCPAGGTPNAAAAAFCTNCGAGLDGQAKTVQLKKDALTDPDAVQPPPQPAPKSPSRTKLVVLGVVLAVLAAVVFFALYKREKPVTVASHSWARTVEVERFLESHEKSDCSGMPGGAELRRKYDESRTRKVKDGEDCHDECTTVRRDRGDGSFKKDKDCHRKCTPRYVDQRYTVAVCEYDIGRWKTDRVEKAGGEALQPEPAWPKPALAAGNGGKGYGREREGAKKEVYDLRFKDDKGKEHTCSLPSQSLWAALKDGSKLKVDFDLLGNPRCGSLKMPGG